MAVIELNLLNSQNEFSQMGEHFQDEHNLQKSPKLMRAPLDCPATRMWLYPKPRGFGYEPHYSHTKLYSHTLMNIHECCAYKIFEEK